MKKIKKTIIITPLILLALMATSQALAYEGNPNQMGPNYSQERHEAMVKAIETRDYNAWRELVGNRGRVSELISKDNFNKFAEAWELARAGKLAEAAKIRQELGLGTGTKWQHKESKGYRNRPNNNFRHAN